MADLFSLIGIVPLDQRTSQHRPVQKYTKTEKTYNPDDIYAQKVVKAAKKITKDRKIRSSLEARTRIDRSMPSREKNSRSKNRVSLHQKPDYENMMNLKPMTRDEAEIVREVEDEFKRRGRFRRIFPSMEYNYYKQFFKQERPTNVLID